MAYEFKYFCGPPVVRPPAPKDGPGPRGLPDCYYTSRVLHSTARYAKFVKRLRADEEEQRKGDENCRRQLKDQQISDFFIRCDRRLLINNVSRRVDLCLQSYENDLNKKRAKLTDLLKDEEERDIRLFVEQAQAASETIWQEKLARLQFLLDKRRREHEEKYKDLPIEKCVHALPCIWKLRAKQAQEIQRYQMKEKLSRKKSEKELDRMWHEVTMKEAEALTARMEVEAIERYRIAQACKEHSDSMLRQREKQRLVDRERLKQETLAWKQKCEADIKQEQDEDEARRKKSMQVGIDRKEAIAERKVVLKKLEAEEKLIEDAWASLAGQGMDEDKAKIALRRRKMVENNICNRKMIELRDAPRDSPEDEQMFQADVKRLEDKQQQERCKYLLWSQKTNADVRKGIMEQITQKKGIDDLKKKMKEEEEYHEQLFKQSEELISHHQRELAKARKEHQKDLIAQIEYNKLLKERAVQEELEQRQKAKKAAEEYQIEINKMVARPFHQETIHPFMKQMVAGCTVKKCPCAKPDYCK